MQRVLWGRERAVAACGRLPHWGRPSPAWGSGLWRTAIFAGLLVGLAACGEPEGSCLAASGVCAPDGGADAAGGATGADGAARGEGGGEPCLGLAGNRYVTEETVDCASPSGSWSCDYYLQLAADSYELLLSDYIETGSYRCDGPRLLDEQGRELGRVESDERLLFRDLWYVLDGPAEGSLESFSARVR